MKADLENLPCSVFAGNGERVVNVRNIKTARRIAAWCWDAYAYSGSFGIWSPFELEN
jgi:hypothetical protein